MQFLGRVMLDMLFYRLFKRLNTNFDIFEVMYEMKKENEARLDQNACSDTTKFYQGLSQNIQEKLFRFYKMGLG